MEFLTANSRTEGKGKSAKKVRRSGNIPGVLYGSKVNNFMFEISELELNREFLKNGEHGILKLNIQGTVHNALIKEIQRDPVNHKIIHLDLEALDGSKDITTEVPINYIGDYHFNAQGAVVQKEKTNVKISCSPEKLPKYLTLDVSNGFVGKTYKLSDIEIAPEISILEDLNSVIASISYNQKLEEVIEPSEE